MLRPVTLLLCASALGGCGRIAFDDVGDPSLIVWYPMDDPDPQGARDATPNHLDATCDPSCPTATPGVIGNGLAFAGGSALVLPDDPRLVLGSGTIACWARVDTIVGSYEQLISRSFGQGLANSVELYVNTNDDIWIGEDALLPKTHVAVTRADLVGTWFHVAASWDTTSVNLYVDGAPAGTIGFGTTFDDHPWRIAADFNNGVVDHTLIGAVDDVRIYGRPLSPAEIEALVTH